MIVIDLGCKDYFAPVEGAADDVSIIPLFTRFSPDAIYGFDPLVEPAKYHLGDTHVELVQQAAWTFDGFIGFHVDGMRSYVFEFEAGVVQCFDVARFIFELTPENTEEVVLKMDVEGAEYPLCRHLYETGADERLKLALVEWHDEARIDLRCPVEEWESAVAA